MLRLEMEPYLLYNQGIQLAKSGDLDGAIAKMLAAHKEMPDNPSVLIILGKLFAKKGSWIEARDWWQKTLDRWPEEQAAIDGLDALEKQEAAEKAELHQSQLQLQRKQLLNRSLFTFGGIIVGLLVFSLLDVRLPGFSPPTPTSVIAVSLSTSIPTPTPLPPTVQPTLVPPTPTPTIQPTASPTPSPSPIPTLVPTPDLASVASESLQDIPQLTELEIDIHQIGNALWLEGEVPNIGVKYLLEAIMKAIPGVELVDVSRLRVVYSVQPDETLSHVSLKMYGRASLWPSIAEANELANPHRIRLGQILIIPPP